MADRQELKHGVRRLQSIKTWQLVVLLVLFGFIAATFLRLNNIGMVQRRDAVYKADEAGDTLVVQQRLYDLQRYVTAHMNADAGAVYLEHQYARDFEKSQTSSGGTTNPNGNIYRKAQDVCAPKFTSYSQAYLQCTVDYLSQYAPATDQSSTVKSLSSDVYRKSFLSPLWTPDFAGFSVLICLLILVMIFVRLIGLFVLRIMLKLSNR